MNIEEVVLSPKKAEPQEWQLGNFLNKEITDGAVVLIICPDYRGSKNLSERKNTQEFRDYLYSLSISDWKVSLVDLGDVILGKNIRDTWFIVEEIITFCLNKKAIPVFLGGSLDLLNAQIKSLLSQEKNMEWSHVGARIDLSDRSSDLSSENALLKIFSDPSLSFNAFHLFGYQQHLNAPEVLNLLKNMDFNVLRLGEITPNIERVEPYLRRTHFFSVDCNAIESASTSFSVEPQVNGFNKREICALMKNAGLSERLKAVGIFNFSYEGIANLQLFSQMLWYLIEGINIRASHPKYQNFETYFVLIDEEEYTFKRDVFSNLWYFGGSETIDECLPCSNEDFDNAKKGILSTRLFRFNNTY